MTHLPYFPPHVTFVILLTMMLFRYFFLCLFFEGYIWLKKPNPISKANLQKKDLQRDMRWSVLSTGVFALISTITIELWHRGELLIYEGVAYPYWYLPIGLVIYLVLHDTYFYWTHRLLHRFMFKKIHFAHHESRRPTAWTSFSFHPWEALIQAIILPLLLLTFPIHWVGLLVFLIIMSVFGVTNHLGYEIYPSFLERNLFLITARHHQCHHEKVGSNFGLYFTFWDRLMRTEESVVKCKK